MSKLGLIALAALASALVVRPAVARADEASSSAAPPPLAVTVTPGTGGGPWRLRIENSGELPVRIAADARLLALDVTPPPGFVDEAASKKHPTAAKKVDDKSVRCILPDDARPPSDEGRELVVPSKRSWSQTFDPLLYCFGEHERARLVVGATVKARFGFIAPPLKSVPRGKAPPLAPPFVAFPVGAALGQIAPAKELAGAPVTLTEAVSAAASATSTAPASPTLRSRSRRRSTSRAAVRSAPRSPSRTTATNRSSSSCAPRPCASAWRDRPARSACGTTREIASPIRELYSTLAVKGRASISVLLTSICPSDTFDRPGIYRVTPMLDTSGATARSIGLKTWDGIAEGRSSMLLRVRTPRRPSDRLLRPSLD